MEHLERLGLGAVAHAQNFTVKVNVTALLAETQALLEPLCDAAGVQQSSCSLQHATVAVCCGAGVVWAVAGHVLLDRPASSSKRKASSESDEEGARSEKPAWRPSRPPERYVDSSEEEEHEQDEEGQDGGKKARQVAAENGEAETEEGLLERRRLMVESRPARMAEAIAELECLRDSDDVPVICDALRKHAGKPADCRPAWLRLQARLRMLVAAESPAQPEAGGEATAAEPAATQSSVVTVPSGSVTVEENPAHDPAPSP
jgi:hypothetical protein